MTTPGKGEETGRIRWLVLAHVASPYLPELFEAMAAHGGAEVLFASWPRVDDRSFSHEAWPLDLARIRQVQVGSPGALRKIAGWKPHIVVALGHAHVGNVLLASWLRLRHRPLMLYFGDTNGLQLVEDASVSTSSAFKLFLKQAVLRRIFDASLDLGWTARVAHRLLGIRRGRDLPLYAVDYGLLDANGAAWPVAAQLRRPLLASVARLVPQKNLAALLEAWRGHLAGGGPGSLAVVGDGPELARLEALAAGVPPDRLRLVGAVPRAQMGSVLQAMDGLVIASTREPWGIVVVEALGCGKPVLASTQVGAAISLVGLAGRAISVSGTTVPELQASLEAFVATLHERAASASLAAPWIRAHYGKDAVAAHLAHLPADELAVGHG
jgi:glycosyltransferase involved in cell wall biosynthesis